ncbi:MAG: DUF362 domain-containing protein [Deltaproteobacteria bacterium]|nr:MAG: DUF362 domain-containing protein [Deltaproteobacteria bacterium]
MPSRVVLIRACPRDATPTRGDIASALKRGIEAYAGRSWKTFLRGLFGRRVRLGLKVNCLGAPGIPTSPAVAHAVAEVMSGAGIPEENLVIWDRQNRELKAAGYRLNYSSSGVRCYGTDTYGVGYERDLLIHGEVGSLLSKIFTRHTDLTVSLPVLKDHILAGYTGTMKNFFGVIHNPNKYHMDNCRPFVTDLFSAPGVGEKVPFTVLDATKVQFHGGPSYNPRFVRREGILLIGEDPVAVDYAGYTLLEKVRKDAGLPPLKEEKREPLYIFDAASPPYSLGNAGEEGVVVEEVT